jgi:type I restriction enzyme S subunit
MTEWEKEKLADLLAVSIGGIWGEEEGESEVDVAVVRVTELKAHGRIDPISAVTRSVTQKQLASRELQEGDLLLEKSGGGPNSPVGRVGYFSQLSTRTVCSNFMQLMRPNPDKVIPKYLFYFLDNFHSNGGTIPMQTATTNIRNIKTPQYMDIDVPLPEINEQQKIVEVLEDHLSRLDTALDEVKKAKLNAAHFRRSILELTTTGNFDKQELIHKNKISNKWELKRLADCLEKLNSGKLAERGWSPQCLNHPVRSENTWGVLKTTAVQMGEYQPEYNKELPTSLVPKIGLEVNPGDFLVTTTGPRNRCGIVCNVKKTPSKLIFSGKILRFRANENIVLSDWLMFVLMSPEFQKTFDKLKVGTSDSSVSIGNKQVLDLYIPVPEIKEQQRIIGMLEEQLSRLDGTVKMAEVIESQSIGLRRSLLQAAFTGQLKKGVVSV